MFSFLNIIYCQSKEINKTNYKIIKTSLLYNPCFGSVSLGYEKEISDHFSIDFFSYYSWYKLDNLDTKTRNDFSIFYFSKYNPFINSSLDGIFISPYIRLTFFKQTYFYQRPIIIKDFQELWYNLGISLGYDYTVFKRLYMSIYTGINYGYRFNVATSTETFPPREDYWKSSFLINLTIGYKIPQRNNRL